jgi:hypothetical protein
MRQSGALAVAVLGLFAFVLPSPTSASASARLVYLRGPGAERCPGEDALRAAVGARLGYDPFFAWARDTLFAEIERTRSGFRFVAKLVDEHNLSRGSREISVVSDDCSDVVDALGLTISLTIDPSTMIGAKPIETAQAAPVAPPPGEVATITAEAPALSMPPAGGPPQAKPQLLAAPPGAREWHLLAGLGAVGSVNAGPSPTVGATLFVGLRWRALSLDVEGRADFPASDSGAPAVRSWLIVGSLVPCVHLGPVFGCLVGGVGALGASGRNVALPTEQYGPWSAAGGRLGAQWAPTADWPILRAYGEFLGTLTQDTLTVDRTGIYTVRPWSADLGIALAWRFR